MSSDTKQILVDYLLDVKKPRAMDVRTFASRVQTINRYIRFLPGDNVEELNLEQIKTVIYKSVPKEWRADFIKANMKLATITLTALIEYMENERGLYDPTPDKTGGGNQKSNDNNGNAGNNNNGNWNNKRKKNKGHSNNGNKKKKLTNEDPCPLPGHGNHKWGECFQNQHGTNFKPRGGGGGSGSGRGGRGGQGGRGSNNGGRGAGGGTHNSTSNNNSSGAGSGYSGPTHQTFYNDAVLGDESFNETPGVTSRTQTIGRSIGWNISEGSRGASLPTRMLSEPGLLRQSGAESETREESTACENALQCMTIFDINSPLLKSFAFQDAPSTPRTSNVTTHMYDLDSYIFHFQMEELQDNISSLCVQCFHFDSSDDDVDFTKFDVPDVPVPIILPDTPTDLVPSSLVVARAVQDQPLCRPLKVLFDSGSNISLLNTSCLPADTTPIMLPASSGFTASGVLEANRAVKLHDLILPEFTRSKRIPEWQFTLFDTPCPFDIIFGRDFLSALKIDPCFSTATVHWDSLSIPFKTRAFWKDPYTVSFYLTHSYAAEIQDSLYQATPIPTLVSQQTHLDEKQRADLQTILEKYTRLFNGQLGLYPNYQVHLELHDNVSPIHMRPYAVPKSQEAVFLRELERLCSLGVLARCGASEWGAPTFIIPKKDGRVRWISDFRELNKRIKRKIYPLPRIQDTLRKRSGYSFFTKLDISMQYYTFALDEASQNLCVIVTPFGKYKYLRLPMGIKQSPDIAQQIMEDVLRDVPDAEVYIDDIGIFSSDWESHVQTLHAVLQRLQDNGFTVNPLKCEWAVKETDWLGYWLTPIGLKPWRKKIDAILRLGTPRNAKEVRAFVGAITFYRDMWPHRSDLLAPLTELTGRGAFTWTPRHQKAFDEIRALIAEDALLRYPDHNKPFHIFTDASDYQLGAVIMQEDVPVAFYSRKLSPAQRNYTTMEKELLSIVETLKEFRSMLFGSDLHVHTDHRNLTYTRLTSQRVLRWRLFLEEFLPTFHYIRGCDNHLADALSRLPQSADALVEKSVSPFDNRHSSDVDSFSIVMDDPALLECFLHHPDPQDIIFPLDYALLQREQFNDISLQAARDANPAKYPILDFGTVPLICYLSEPNATWKIAIPTPLLNNVVKWYHCVLNHTGMTRLLQTINSHLYHPQLKLTVETVVQACETCQRYKLVGPGYGTLPPREAPLAPWDEVAIDLIGPWKIQVNGQELVFHALTCIDPVTNLTELIRINNKSSAHVGMKFENEWLARYPRPLRCIHDHGTEFTGCDFQRILTLNGIKDVATSNKNPQANAVCERMHQTITNILRPLLHTHVPQNDQAANDIIDTALATASYASRAAVHRTLSISPGALVFRRDMFLDIPLLADLETIRNKRQVLIDENLRRQNLKRRSFDYQVGQQVLILNSDIHPAKLDPTSVEGPFPIVQVHTNGTVTIQRSAVVTERINIRRLRPFRTGV
jgi:transposase InsO family protein